jgi:hypothetical protein
MFTKIKELIKKTCTIGIYFPFAYDPTTKQPSVTLLFSYITFIMSAISVTALHFKQTLLVPTLITLLFWCVSVVFYMIRSIQKAKIDFDDKSIELEGEEND